MMSNRSGSFSSRAAMPSEKFRKTVGTLNDFTIPSPESLENRSLSGGASSMGSTSSTLSFSGSRRARRLTLIHSNACFSRRLGKRSRAPGSFSISRTVATWVCMRVFHTPTIKLSKVALSTARGSVRIRRRATRTVLPRTGFLTVSTCSVRASRWTPPVHRRFPLPTSPASS